MGSIPGAPEVAQIIVASLDGFMDSRCIRPDCPWCRPKRGRG